MKKIVILIALISLLSGCALFKSSSKISGNTVKKEEKAKQVIQNVDDKINDTNTDKLDKIGVLSHGTDYALNKAITETNPIAIVAAKELNQRVIVLGNQPSIEDIKNINALVETFMTNKVQADKLLSQKDSQIEALNNSVKELKLSKNKAINDFIKLADKNALQEDTIQSELKAYTGLWGVNAIFKGTWSLISHLFWVLTIGGALFIVLRLLSFSNPLAASIFGIFSKIGSLLINTIEYIFPKSIAELELVTAEIHSKITTELGDLKNNVVQAAVTKTSSTPIVTPNVTQS